jgi:hypothetical protein
MAGDAYICPLFFVVATGEGDLWYCDGYPESCDDIPEVAWYTFPISPDPYTECPRGCLAETVVRNGRTYPRSILDSDIYLAAKVPVVGDIPGLNRYVTSITQRYRFFSRNGQNVYVRICKFVHHDPAYPNHTRSFSLGLETFSPPEGNPRPGELNNYERISDTMYSTLMGDELVVMLCVKTAADEKSKAAHRCH